MKVIVTYVFPHLGTYDDAARRFVASALKYPSTVDHQFFIMVNGGDFENRSYVEIFKPLDPIFLRHDNSGLDIGAFQLAARSVDKSICDVMVFCGSSTYIKRADWLNRVVQSFTKHGDTLFGAMGHRGYMVNKVYPHIRTTGFWMSPTLMNSYPYLIKAAEHRYEFEHGQRGLTQWVISKNKTPWVVCGTGEFNQPLWDSIPNGYHKGTQENLLFGDRLTMKPHGCD